MHATQHTPRLLCRRRAGEGGSFEGLAAPGAGLYRRWSAFFSRPSPRGLKRFAIRLHLAATDECVPANAVTLGLAGLAHINCAPAGPFAAGAARLEKLAGAQFTLVGDPAPVRSEFASALEELAAASLPSFVPSPHDTEACLAV